MEEDIIFLCSLIVAIVGVVIGGVFGFLGWLIGLPELWKLGFLFFWPGMIVILWHRYREGKRNE